MSVEIKGIDNLIKKLSKLSTLETKEAVQEVAKDMSIAIKAACPVDTSEGKDEVGLIETRDYNNSTYIDVGLSSRKSDWEKIRGAYFNNYGWISGGSLHKPHRGWFEDAVAQQSRNSMAKLKKRLKQQIKDI